MQCVWRGEVRTAVTGPAAPLTTIYTLERLLSVSVTGPAADDHVVGVPAAPPGVEDSHLPTTTRTA